MTLSNEIKKYYNYENGETLTKDQHLKNVRDLLENFADLTDDLLEDNAEKLEALSGFISTLSSYANDDVLRAVYHEYQNMFTVELV